MTKTCKSLAQRSYFSIRIIKSHFEAWQVVFRNWKFLKKSESNLDQGTHFSVHTFFGRAPCDTRSVLCEWSSQHCVPVISGWTATEYCSLLYQSIMWCRILVTLLCEYVSCLTWKNVFANFSTATPNLRYFHQINSIAQLLKTRAAICRGRGLKVLGFFVWPKDRAVSCLCRVSPSLNAEKKLLHTAARRLAAFYEELRNRRWNSWRAKNLIAFVAATIQTISLHSAARLEAKLCV
jgi:hypothetical protein